MIEPGGGRRHWTSAEVARAFRVGVSSVKRWTEEGELEAVKTPGKHRRYTLTSLYRFASLRGLPTDLLPQIADAEIRERLQTPQAAVLLFAALRRGDAEAVRRLVTPRMNGLAKRAAFLDRVVGDAMREIGRRWARGTLMVDEEHRMSYMVSEAIDLLRPPAAAGARHLALLSCPPGELHEIPLRLIRLVLEWWGWRTEYIGADAPWDSLRHAVETRGPRLVLLSARDADLFRFVDFDRFVQYARGRSVGVAIGGEWARGGRGRSSSYLRFRTLRGFVRWLRSEPAAA
jgi:excisionase family DNA binding protein